MAAAEILAKYQSLTNAVEVLAHLSCNGQAGRHIYTTPGHLAKVGTLATE